MTKGVVMASWDDAAHLTSEQKEKMLASIPPFQRKARSQGIPQMGAGLIYPVDETDIIVDPFPIPDFWPRVYSMDVGWKRTAALWGAYDRESETWYLYSEHYRGEAEPSVHAAAIRSRGEWIKGIIDPAARGRGQVDGRQLMQLYKDLGLNLTDADNTVGNSSGEGGLYSVYERLSGGKIKVFRTLQSFLGEYRLYRRDEKGRIVKVNDHLMDCISGDSQIITRTGVKMIRDLVGTSGEVIGLDGKWKKYYDCGVRRVNSPVIALTFSDGSTVKCTSDHLFLTPRGWERAQSLMDAYRYDIIDPCASPSFRIQNKNSSASRIGYAENIFSAMAFACTGLFGSMRIGVKFLMDITSIMSMAIGRTISLTISHALRMQNICLVTTKESQESWRHLRWSKQPNGIGVKSEKNGMQSMQRTVGRKATHGSIETVINVESNLELECVTDASVIQIASRQNCEPEDVYCLSVPDGHAFVMANGLLSHNCLRYLIASGLKRAIVKPVKVEEPAFFPTEFS
jgi:hypothetical protein